MKSFKSVACLITVVSGFILPNASQALILDRFRGNDRDYDYDYDHDHHEVRTTRPSVGVSVYRRPNYYYDDDPYYYDERLRYYSRRSYYYDEPVSRRVYVKRTVHRSLEADVQQALARRGYYRGPIDGSIGPGSRAAIRRYQANRGLRVTGLIDHKLLRSLGL